MKKFVLITQSDSGDSYHYLIEHPQKPTSDEIDAFLMENASDQREPMDEDDEPYCYEQQEMLFEINEFQRIPGFEEDLKDRVKNFVEDQVDLDDDFTVALDEVENKTFNPIPKKVRF